MLSSCLLRSEGSFAPCPQDGWGNSGGGSQDSFRCFCGYDIFVFFWVVIRDLYCVGIFAWVWVSYILSWFSVIVWVIKDCYMSFWMSRVLNKSLEGCILLSGFQHVQLLIRVFIGINPGVLFGGSWVRVSSLVLL